MRSEFSNYLRQSFTFNSYKGIYLFVMHQPIISQLSMQKLEGKSLQPAAEMEPYGAVIEHIKNSLNIDEVSSLITPID